MRAYSARFRAHPQRPENHRNHAKSMIGRPKFVLASGSPRRLALINQAGIEPDALKPCDLDETPKRGEIPRASANRLANEKAQCLRLLSGRNHRVYTSICLVTPRQSFRQRIVESRVRFKRLSEEDIEAYLASGEWRGKAGGYAAQGIAGTFIVKLVGSYSNVVGLPLYETMQLLGGEGYPIRFGWLNAVAAIA